MKKQNAKPQRRKDAKIDTEHQAHPWASCGRVGNPGAESDRIPIYPERRPAPPHQ